MKPSDPNALISAAQASGEGPEDAGALGPDDFQRIGLRPKESRLDVIRRAASRATKSLARRQLSAPHPLTEQQLSRIAVSTYRLLDPRQRPDRLSRASVGRIRAGILYRAGKAEFVNGKILIPSADATPTAVATHHGSEFLQRTHTSPPLPSATVAINDEALVGATPQTLDFALPHAKTRRALAIRSRSHRLRFFATLLMITALTITALLLWNASDQASVWFDNFVSWSSAAE